MDKDSKQTLVHARFSASASESGSEDALVLRERAFDQDPSAIDLAEEATALLPAVLGLRPLAAVLTAPVDRNDCGSNAQVLSGEPMKLLGVVGGVGQQAVDGDETGCLADGRFETRSVVAGALGRFRSGPQVRLQIADDRQLWPEGRFETPGFGSAVDVMSAGVVRFEARGVDGGLELRWDQATFSCESQDAVKESLETPFFKRRFSAFSRVVQ